MLLSPSRARYEPAANAILGAFQDGLELTMSKALFLAGHSNSYGRMVFGMLAEEGLLTKLPKWIAGHEVYSI